MSGSDDDEYYRKKCDACRKREPVKLKHPGDLLAGAMITISGARNLRKYRTLAKRALKVYNKSNSKSFKLKKLYKVNYHGACYHHMTFSAQEDGSEERPLFRGVVRGGREDRVKFCEIKEDDEITLPSDDDRPPPQRT